MKTIDTHGITYIEPVPEGTSEWYYGISKEYGDLYEAEETFRRGRSIKGNSLCLIHFPDGEVFWPFPKTIGTCTGKPVYLLRLSGPRNRASNKTAAEKCEELL